MIEKLLNKHIVNLRKLITIFQKKHDLPYFDDFGLKDSFIYFSDFYCFSIDNILFDLSTNQPKGLIIEWFNADLETSINFNSYSMGLRTKEDLIKDLEKKVEESRQQLLNCIENDKHK